MPSPVSTDQHEPDAAAPARPALGISPAQIAGSALAAVSAAFFASWLGVTGTLIGAALGSVVGTVGSAMYTYSLQVSHQVVRRPVSSRRPQQQVPPDPEVAGWRALPWPRIALGTGAVLLITLIALTAFEGLTGKPVSSLTGGSDSGGTTISHVVGGSSGRDQQDDPSPTPPSDSSSPTDPATTSPSPAPTESPTPSGSPSPSESPSPTSDPSPSVGGSASVAP